MSLKTAPARLYGDPAVYASERRLIFGASWLYLGLERELAEPGDYLANVLAGWPVVVVRDGDGALRAFHNVCRHRAGPLVSDAAGRCAGAFVCRYHGWRYALDGRLRNAAGFGRDTGFDAADLGLLPVRVETWRGFVFVNLDLDAGPLGDLLAPLDPLFEGRSLPPATLTRAHEIACDWKVYVENYLEGYHIPAVHPALAADVDAGAYSVRMEGAVAIHEVPAGAGAAEGLWAWIWPNLAFNIYRGVVMVEHMRPLGPGRTVLEYAYLHEPGDPQLDAALETSGQLTVEDRWICERVQENLSAGAYVEGVLSPRHEVAVAWFQGTLRDRLGL